MAFLGALAGAAGAGGAAGAAGAAGAGAAGTSIAGLANTIGAGAGAAGAAGAGAAGMGTMAKIGSFVKEAAAPGGMARMIGSKFKGNPITDTIGAFGNSFDPITGGFNPIAFMDKDARKDMELQRKAIEELLAGKQTPITAVFSRLLSSLNENNRG